MDDNGDGFSDEVLSERISVFNKWAFHRKSGRIFDFSAKYYFEDRFGGIENWTPEYKGSDSIYGEVIKTNRWELSSRYELPSNQNIYGKVLTTFTIRIVIMEILNTKELKTPCSINYYGIKTLDFVIN